MSESHVNPTTTPQVLREFRTGSVTPILNRLFFQFLFPTDGSSWEGTESEEQTLRPHNNGFSITVFRQYFEFITFSIISGHF